jgi:hypothetical protein
MALELSFQVYDEIITWSGVSSVGELEEVLAPFKKES